MERNLSHFHVTAVIHAFPSNIQTNIDILLATSRWILGSNLLNDVTDLLIFIGLKVCFYYKLLAKLGNRSSFFIKSIPIRAVSFINILPA